MKIKIDIHTWTIKEAGSMNGYKYDSLRIKESSGHRLYLTGMRDGMRIITVTKMMKFEDGKVYISFKGKKIEIGTYEEVE